MDKIKKMDKEKVKDDFLVKLKEAAGIVGVACEQVGIARSTYYRWCRDDEAFREKAEDIVEGQVDFVENRLLKKIREGDTTAMIFYLKTKGKKRGYSEKAVPVDVLGKNIEGNANLLARNANLLAKSETAVGAVAADGAAEVSARSVSECEASERRVNDRKMVECKVNDRKMVECKVNDRKMVERRVNDRKMVERKVKNKKAYIVKLLRKQGKYTEELTYQVDVTARLLVRADMLSEEMLSDGHKTVNVEYSREGNERVTVNPVEKLYLDVLERGQRALRALGMNTESKERKTDGDSFGEFLKGLSNSD